MSPPSAAGKGTTPSTLLRCKENWMRGTTIAAFVLLFVFLAIDVSNAWELTVITEEFPPYNFTRNGKPTGATTAVVREILKRQGQEEKIVVLPWARGYKRLLTEPNIVLYTTARTAERESQFHWVGPLYEFRLGFYARKGAKLPIESLEDAKKVRAIATYKDDFREQILASLGFKNLDSSKDPQSNIRKLVAGRADLWFFDNIGAPTVAREAGLDPSEIEEVLTYQTSYSYIAISKKTPQAVADQWQATLDEIKADGTFQEITSQWIPLEALMRNPARKKANATDTLQIYTEDAPPSSYMEDSQLKGMSVEIVQEILRRLKLPGKIELVPWARGYGLARNEPNVVLFSTTRLPQRENLFQWAGPLYEQNWGFYGVSGRHTRIASMSEAKRVDRIGTYRKDAKMQYLTWLGFTNLVSTNRNITNITHLIRGDIDLWVSSDFNMEHIARQAGVNPGVIELVYPFQKVGNYIAFSQKTAADTVRQWQQTLDDIKQDGTYERICRKYGYMPKR
jgi:ABC-type amino acid transport substrate-binding protein